MATRATPVVRPTEDGLSIDDRGTIANVTTTMTRETPSSLAKNLPTSMGTIPNQSGLPVRIAPRSLGVV